MNPILWILCFLAVFVIVLAGAVIGLIVSGFDRDGPNPSRMIAPPIPGDLEP